MRSLQSTFSALFHMTYEWNSLDFCEKKYTILMPRIMSTSIFVAADKKMLRLIISIVIVVICSINQNKWIVVLND